MTSHANTVSAAQDAGLMKKIHTVLELLSERKRIEDFDIFSNQFGQNRRIAFRFPYDERTIQASFLLANSSEEIAHKDVAKGHILLLTTDLSEQDIVSFIEDLKTKKIKGYHIEKKAFEILMQEKKGNFKIETVSYATPYEDQVLKVDLLVRVNYYVSDPLNSKLILDVPIQLKASFKGQQLHKEKYPWIPSIVFYETMTAENFVVQVEKILERYKVFYCKKIIDPQAKPDGFHI